MMTRWAIVLSPGATWGFYGSRRSASAALRGMQAAGFFSGALVMMVRG